MADKYVTKKELNTKLSQAAKKDKKEDQKMMNKSSKKSK